MSMLKFRAEVREGKLYPLSRSYFDKNLQHFEGNVVVTIEKLQSKRSINQNSYYWGVVLPTIAEHTGHSVEELHGVFTYGSLKFVGISENWSSQKGFSGILVSKWHSCLAK